MRFDPNKLSHKMIIAGLVGMIEDDGLTFHEAMAVVEDIKKQTFPALMQISRERKTPAIKTEDQ